MYICIKEYLVVGRNHMTKDIIWIDNLKIADIEHSNIIG